MMATALPQPEPVFAIRGTMPSSFGTNWYGQWRPLVMIVERYRGSATLWTLRRRRMYGGRKGRRAAARIRAKHYYQRMEYQYVVPTTGEQRS
jgi:hypothetical protein